MRIVGYDVETVPAHPDTPSGEREVLCVTWYRAAEWGDEGTRGRSPSGTRTTPSTTGYLWRPTREMLAQLEEDLVLLAGPRGCLTSHNSFFDMSCFPSLGTYEDDPPVYCTLVAGTLLDPVEKNSLEALAQHYLGESKTEGIDRRRLLDEPRERVVEYCQQDSRLHALVLRAMLAELRADPWVWSYFEERCHLAAVLARTHREGICLDVERTQRTLRETAERAAQLEKDLLRGHPDLNLNSPQQVAQLLEGWGITLPRTPSSKNFPEGQPSVSRAVLAGISREGRDPASRWCEDLLAYRTLSKEDSTYLSQLPTTYLWDDGRLRPSYHLGKGIDYGHRRGKDRMRETGTRTLRLSSSDPNIQNQSRDPRIRGLFVAAPGRCLVKADYSQLEFRVFGWMSDDPAMQEAFRRDFDFHTFTTALIFQEPYEEVARLVGTDPVWKERRYGCKTVNFTILFGGGIRTVHDSLLEGGWDISMGEVRELHEGWFRRFPTAGAWSQAVIREAATTGRVVTPLGIPRKLLPPGASSWEDLDTAQRARMSRQAVNTLVQNFASEITNEAILQLDLAFEEHEAPPARLWATVHDEIVLETTPGEGAAVRELLVSTMEEGALRGLEERGVADLERLVVRAEAEGPMHRWSGELD